MDLEIYLGNIVDFHETDVEKFLNYTSAEDIKDLYTGTSLEDFERKLEASGDYFKDWEDNRLWFTPHLHDRPHCAAYYACEALDGGKNRHLREAETPIILQWEVKEEWITDKEIGREEYLKHFESPEEYCAEKVPVESLNGVMYPDKGSRVKEDWQLDPKGWQAVEVELKQDYNLSKTQPQTS